jgi:hypothetical protein
MNVLTNWILSAQDPREREEDQRLTAALVIIPRVVAIVWAAWVAPQGQVVLTSFDALWQGQSAR